MYVTKSHPLEAQKDVIWQYILSKLRVKDGGWADNDILFFREVEGLGGNRLDRSLWADPNAFPTNNTNTLYAGYLAFSDSDGLCGASLHTKHTPVAKGLVYLDVTYGLDTLSCLGH